MVYDLQIIGNTTKRGELVSWEAELSHSNGPIPGKFDVSSPREGLLAAIKRRLEELDAERARNHTTRVTHLTGIFTLAGAFAGGLIGLIGFIWAKCSDPNR